MDGAPIARLVAEPDLIPDDEQAIGGLLVETPRPPSGRPPVALRGASWYGVRLP